MDGLLFYWFAWIGLILTTFFMSKQHHARYSLSVWLYLLIISSPYSLSIMGTEVYLSAFVLFSYFIINTAKITGRVFISVFLSSFIIMLGYVSFLLFALFDPVWVIFDRKWMLALGGTLLGFILQEDPRFRGLILASGMLLGEIVFSGLMKRLSFPYPVASPVFLDIIAITMMAIGLWSALNYIAQATGHYFYHGRGKQKSS